MIATIICGLILLLGIVLSIIAIKERDETVGTASAILITISIGISSISLCFGYIDQTPSNLEREDLIENFKRCPCDYHYEQIEKWNEHIEIGNNYWCRFKLRDTDLYTIKVYEVFEIKVVGE